MRSRVRLSRDPRAFCASPARRAHGDGGCGSGPPGVTVNATTLQGGHKRTQKVGQVRLPLPRIDPATDTGGVGIPLVRNASGLEVACASTNCAFGRFQGYLVVSWRIRVHLADVKSVVAFRDEMLATDFRGAIHMAEPGLALPDEPSRRWAQRGMAHRTDKHSAVALVIFGTGFGASAIRSVSTAIFALRSGPPTRIFGVVPEAIEWLAEQAVDRVQTADFANACQELRRMDVVPRRSMPSLRR